MRSAILRFWFPRLALISLAAAAANAQNPAITSGGIVNAASFAAPVAPGSLISIFGANLAGGLAQADSIPLATQLSNVSVTVNNIAAPLLFVSQGQINAQLPWNTLSSGTSGSASVVVTNNGKVSTAQSVQVGPVSPGIFSQPLANGNFAIAINAADGSLAIPAGAIPGITSHPAKAGDTLIILCTGLGATDNSAPNGGVPTKLATALQTPQVLVGGMSITPLFAGLTPQFVGVNQINVTLPTGVPTGNAVSLQLSVGGITSATGPTIAVQ
jgi:uncharacterized protein (TIGR03437 family)